MKLLSFLFLSLSVSSTIAGEGASSGGPGNIFMRALKQDRSWRRILENKRKYRVSFPLIKIEQTGIYSSAKNFCIQDGILISGKTREYCTSWRYFGSEESKVCEEYQIVKLETPVVYSTRRKRKNHSWTKLAHIYKKRTRHSNDYESLHSLKKFKIPKCDTATIFP